MPDFSPQFAGDLSKREEQYTKRYYKKKAAKKAVYSLMPKGVSKIIRAAERAHELKKGKYKKFTRRQKIDNIKNILTK